ncbi:MAG: protein kinase [Betaproteobacteria bacterium]|nr:protein kinase [Betaproteobacteria bacterium]
MVEILNYRNSLPLGSMLLEYRLESILGAGGFGMTYLGYDTNLEKKVAIKEYLPVELAVRALDGSIVPINTGTEYNYKWGLDRFLQEARLLAKFIHPNIVTVSRYFEANGTAYMVMNYESGMSLSQLLKRIPQPDEPMLRQILMPLLEGLQAVHEAGFLHRDIKPSNIFIRDTGAPLLIDFGAARLAVGGATRTMTSILTPGFAPLEQYSKDGNQGPWTDIYSLAAVMCRAVVGDNPPDVVTRMKDDVVMQSLIAARDRFSPGFLHAINRGMEVDEKKRPQTVPEWTAMFTGEAYATPTALPTASAAVPATGNAHEDAPTQRVEKTTLLEGRPTDKRPSMAQLTWFAAGALVLFLVIGGEQFFRKPAEDAVKSRLAPATKTQPGTKAEPEPGKDQPTRLTPREFYVLDRDRSGFLTPDEVKGDAVLETNFAKIDTNHDGRISLEEYTSFP